MTRKRSRNLGIALISATLLAGCSKPPSDKDLVDSMVSWIGTADMASQAWLNHTTFDRYTRETLELSATQLGEQHQQLKELPSGSTLSPALDSAVALARHSMLDIASLIAAKDAPDVQPKLDSLRSAKKVVLAISDSLDKKQ